MKLTKVYTTITLLTLIVFSSCTSTESNENNQENAENNLVTGKIIETVTCRMNSAHTYAYYLPTTYDASRSYPVILVFDAHARGQLAVSKFKQLAEQYGFIVVGSNSSKNGLKDINPVINSLWDDVFVRFSVDANRVYTSGFSGGAKVASSVAIYKGGVKGVIACAGGMPVAGQELKSKFDYVGIVGNHDFNYQEIKALCLQLSENKFNNFFISFDGAHEWPNSEVLAKAMQWLQLMDMKRGDIPVDDNLIRDYTTRYADTINNSILTGNTYNAYLLYYDMLSTLNGFVDISEYQKGYEELLKDPKIGEAIKKHEKEQEIEFTEQDDLLNKFKVADYNALKADIIKLKSANDNLSKRLLSFAGILSYIYTESAVNSQNKGNYQQLIEIYELAEPQNPDKEYFKACQAIMDDNQSLALEKLKKAVEFGYSDASKLMTIGYFESLRTLPEFDVIVQKAMKNSRN